jgi:chemotaxis signal transduction protein
MQVLLFQTGGRLLALPSREISEIVLRPALTRLGEEPPWLEGYFCLESDLVPVLRADRILGQGEDSRSLYTHLLVLNVTRRPVALAVERAQEIVEVAADQLTTVRQEDSFNQCVAAMVIWNDEQIPLLSGRRMLLDEEQQRVDYWTQRASERLSE